jgi:hypothetical protein
VVDSPGVTAWRPSSEEEVVAETVDEVTSSSVEDEETKDEEATDEEATDEESPSITELFVQLGRDVSVLVFCESQLAASRNMPEVRRAARDIAGALIAALAFLTAFAFANVAAFDGLKTAMSPWLAALALCAAWLVLGVALTLALMVRAGHVTGWKWWRVFWQGREESLEDLERAKDDAEKAVRETLTTLAPAMTVEIATASVAVTGDMAGNVVEAGGDLLESSDEIVDAIAEDLPAGGVVSQVWDIVLMPPRFGVKAATTVFRRGNSQG